MMKKILRTALFIVLGVMKTGLGQIDFQAITKEASAAQEALTALQTAAQEYDKKPLKVLKRACLYVRCKPTTTETRKLETALTAPYTSQLTLQIMKPKAVSVHHLKETLTAILDAQQLTYYQNDYISHIEQCLTKLKALTIEKSLETLYTEFISKLEVLLYQLLLLLLPPKPAGMARSASSPKAAMPPAAHQQRLPRAASLPLSAATRGAAKMSAAETAACTKTFHRSRAAYLAQVAAQGNNQ